MSYKAVNQYAKVGTQSGVEHANPHRLIQMLMAGSLEKIATAKGHMERGNVAEKGRHISWAISIIGGLQASLDLKQGGELASNLNDLYEYMCERLVLANINNDTEILDEASRIMTNIKAGWDGIEDEAKNIFSNQNTLSTDSVS
ncbi:MAG: flagellar export chaperone FliS [Pseudomonadota bacterium]